MRQAAGRGDTQIDAGISNSYRFPVGESPATGIRACSEPITFKSAACFR